MGKNIDRDFASCVIYLIKIRCFQFPFKLAYIARSENVSSCRLTSLKQLRNFIEIKWCLISLWTALCVVNLYFRPGQNAILFMRYLQISVFFGCHLCTHTIEILFCIYEKMLLLSCRHGQNFLMQTLSNTEHSNNLIKRHNGLHNVYIWVIQQNICFFFSSVRYRINWIGLILK
jgi:hypothetical protein